MNEAIKVNSGHYRRNYFQRAHSELIGKLMLKIKFKENGCWELISGIRENGYSRISFKGKNFYSHRVFFQYFNSKPKKGMDICHKCDNRNCVNPSHLFEGSRKVNMQDCVEKGRIANGEKLSRKLKSSDILYIRNSTLSSVELAEKFNVTRHTIRNIITLKTWKHIK